MPQPTRVTLPPSGRPPGGLLTAARPIGGEWWRGVMFSSGRCLVPQNVGPCPTEPATEKVRARPSDAATFQAFNVIQAVECSTLGRSDMGGLANQSLDVTREFGVASELLTGAATANPSLAGAVLAADDLGSATDPIAALGCLDQMAGVALSGRLAFIHAPITVANAWLAAGAIWRDGRLWRTVSGSIVVSSPAYDGRAPGGAAPGPGDTMYAYATGEVFAEVGQRETLQSVDRAVNTDTAIAEDAAIVGYDPCFAIGVDTTVVFCAGVS